MIVNVSVIHPCDAVDGWKTQLTAAVQQQESISTVTQMASLGKEQHAKFKVFYWMHTAFPPTCLHIFVQLLRFPKRLAISHLALLFPKGLSGTKTPKLIASQRLRKLINSRKLISGEVSGKYVFYLWLSNSSWELLLGQDAGNTILTHSSFYLLDVLLSNLGYINKSRGVYLSYQLHQH